MEKPNSLNILRNPFGILVALGGVSLLSGCAAGSHEVLANKPTIVVSESESQVFVTVEQGGGYPHYESVYRFILEQCNRGSEPIADKNGCVELNTVVDEKTYEKFAPGDTIVFDSDRTGYLVQ
ncbi:MAG: hypothetical protein ACOH18_03210 [Candidatus Saccharimonadaceae bacterium]